MTYCLCCNEGFFEKISWHYICGLTIPSPICEQCSEKLEEIIGDICEKCGRPFKSLEPKFRENNICTDCIKWNEHSGALQKNRSLYVYNDFLQEIIAKWKYRGDAELVKLFRAPLQKAATQLQIDVVVPIPLNSERLYERSFNQAKLLAEQLTYPIVEPLLRTNNTVKQSKKSREQRLHQHTTFQIDFTSATKIKNKAVLIIDDIYTTGATIHSAAQLIKEHGAKTINSLTVARS